LLSVFSEFEREMLRESLKAGIAEARERGTPHGRPQTAALLSSEGKKMFDQGLSKAEIARRLSIGRTSVIRILAN
jgi:putative DNA-invertase from lambdoid prophage Rac